MCSHKITFFLHKSFLKCYHIFINIILGDKFLEFNIENKMYEDIKHFFYLLFLLTNTRINQ